METLKCYVIIKALCTNCNKEGMRLWNIEKRCDVPYMHLLTHTNCHKEGGGAG